MATIISVKIIVILIIITLIILHQTSKNLCTCNSKKNYKESEPLRLRNSIHCPESSGKGKTLIGSSDVDNNNHDDTCLT